MSRPTWLRIPVLLVAALLLAAPVFATGQKSAPSAPPSLNGFLSSLWLGFSRLAFSDQSTSDGDRGPIWDPWGSGTDSTSPPPDPDRGPGWDPWG